MERKYDLTKGDVFRTILMFMLPILAGNVFQQLYSAVDTIIVGRTLGSDALASVGSIGSLQFLVFGFCSGLAGGVTVVTSQFIGAGKTENARRSTAVIYMIWAVVSLLCTVVGIVCLPGLLHILNMPEENVEKFRRKINENCPLTVEEVCPDIHIDMAMPVGYASTELVHQFALLEPFGKDNPSPLFADRNLSISRMWVIGKNRNVLRMSVLSEYGQPVPVIFFGDVETLFAYFTEKFGQEEVENALHGRKNRILFSMVYTAKVDFYQGNENLQLEMKYYR